MEDNKYIPSSLKRIIDNNMVISTVKRGLPNPGSRPDGRPFFSDLRKIDDAYLLGNEVYGMGVEVPNNMISYNSGNGSPLLHNAFYPAVKEAIESLRGTEISQYAYASGDKMCRRQVADYLNIEGFVSDSEDGLITENQVIFFNSTTEAFSIIMKLVCRPGDVVLFAGPTYGLLVYAPERVGGISKIIPLSEEDDWIIDPDKLDKTIKKINGELRLCDEYDYIPCVTAYVNINPNNPTGRVMGKDDIGVLEELNNVCKKNGVLIIDDIIYRDLSFNMRDKAVPIASLRGAFSNTITMFGTSKSFGLAGVRAGVVLANEKVIRGLRNELFQLMDSTSLVISHILAGSFNGSEEREEYYDNYFRSIIGIYKSNWKLMKVLIDGENDSYSLDESEKDVIKKYFKEDTAEILEKGIKELKIAGNIEPQAGFFALVDFSGVIGFKDAFTNTILSTEMDVLYYFYRTAYVKLLTGDSFAWPIANQVVARVSFAYEKNDLVRMMHQIYTAIRKLVKVE